MALAALCAIGLAFVGLGYLLRMLEEHAKFRRVERTLSTLGLSGYVADSVKDIATAATQRSLQRGIRP